jgi:hypothetical protein
LYQEFTCTGVRLKVTLVRNCFDALGTIPVSVEWALDDMQPLANGINPTAVNLSAYANYQYGSIPDSYSISRYLSTAALKKRLGVGWCATSDPNFTYLDQLPLDTNPSLFLRIFCSTGIPPGNSLGNLTITYYYKFRGLDFGVNP